ncbi:hypothetical protein MKZ38_007070 [Zalerion maritima]|uniref:Uncharacterized protein n=1 Tax=Zalerion maritima TaxID=339359 RepID=A0AAD5RID5_9PEZI|nr:hypothetical protein MKZ38_007070 [Zalerion maritima]
MAFLTKCEWNCEVGEDATTAYPSYQNMGWRYHRFTGRCLVLTLCLLRLFVIKVRETPKYPIGPGDGEQVVSTLQFVAKKYKRDWSLTLEDLKACGEHNYTYGNVVSIFGPLAAWVCNQPRIGRRGAMAIPTCLITYFVTAYYAVLYAYTPEALPSAHRTTGNGIGVVTGIVAALVGTVTDPQSSTPMFFCGGLFASLATIALVLPFEPCGRRSSYTGVCLSLPPHHPNPLYSTPPNRAWLLSIGEIT